MKNQGQNYSEQNRKIEAAELETQLALLLKDYFYGNFEKVSDGVLMKMDNGQTFKLSVKEV